jgi:hypothetical protein
MHRRRASAGLATAALLIAAPSAGAEVQRLSFGPAGGNAANQPVSFMRATPDLKTVLCETAEPLTADDTDTEFDVYRCAGAASQRVSVGENGLGNTVPNDPIQDSYFQAQISDDGTNVFLATGERLTTNDTDHVASGNPSPHGSVDVYRIVNGTPTLMTTGPNDPQSAANMDEFKISPDGSKIIFHANGSPLRTGDPGFQHFYFFDGATLQRVSDGSNLNPGDFFGGASDLSRIVYFSTSPETTSAPPADDKDRGDIFGWIAGVRTLLTPGPASANPPSDFLHFDYVSTDGHRAVFDTNAPLVGADTDTATDVYVADDTGVHLLSTGPVGGNADGHGVQFAGASADATHVVFCTDEALVAADTNTDTDVYERTGATTRLVSGGGAGGDACVDEILDEANDRGSVSASGDRIVFSTRAPLVAGDTDNKSDVYERAGDTLTLLSTGSTGGNGAFNAEWVGESADGKVVFFKTTEKLTAADHDAASDIYARTGGQTVLVTPDAVAGPATGVKLASNLYLNEAIERPVAADGSSIIVETTERLTADDTDTQNDLYRATITPPAEQPPPEQPPAQTPPAQIPISAPAPGPSLPVTPASTAPAPPKLAQLITGLPSTRRCVSRRSFRIRLRIPKGADGKKVAVTSVSVFVNGKRVAVRKGKRLTAPVDLRRLPKGRFSVKITIVLGDGRVVTGTRKYRTCARKRHGGKPPPV